MPSFNLDFTNCFSPNFFKVSNSTARKLWLYGGAGSGKTYSIAQFLILETFMNRALGRTIYVIKKNQSKMKSTIINDFYNPNGGGIVFKWGVSHLFTYNKTDRTLTNTKTGVTIKFMGVDNPEHVKGLTAPHIIFVDEISDYLNSEVYKQLLTRVRIKGARFIFAFNPIDEDHWIKKELFDNHERNREIIKTTYKDNYEVVSGRIFIDDNYIEELESYKERDLNYYRIYVQGEWGRKVPTSGRFYSDFDINYHVKKSNDISYSKDLPLHISFDFNVNPYMTCNIWQYSDGHARQIDEMCLEYPKNNTPATARHFARKYSDHESKIFIYGDPSGHSKDTRGEKGWNDFTFIEEELKKYSLTYDKRVKSKAPNISARGIFINKLFRGDVKGKRISIHENCSETIKDYVYLLENMEGKKHKETVRDENKVTYEKYGHTSDANDYFLSYIFADEMNKMKGGRKQIISGK